MNAEIRGNPACYVWGVETEDGVILVRAVSAAYDELMNRIGKNGQIPLPPDCDGICDVFLATPELCKEIRKQGTGIICRLVERDGILMFDRVQKS